MDVHTIRGVTLSALLALGLSGCGDLTAGGLGEGQVTVGGDDAPSSAFLAESPAATSNGEEVGALEVNGTGPIKGDVLVTLTVLLVHQDGRTADLSGGPREMILQADGSNQVTLAPVGVPTGPYQGVRLLFHSVEADVRSGLPFGGRAAPHPGSTARRRSVRAPRRAPPAATRDVRPGSRSRA